MSSDPTPQEEHLQDLYDEIGSLLEGRRHVSPADQAIVLLRIAIENGGAQIGMTGIMHVISSMMTQTLGIMSDSDNEDRMSSYDDELADSSVTDQLESILRDFNQNKTSEH